MSAASASPNPRRSQTVSPRLSPGKSPVEDPLVVAMSASYRDARPTSKPQSTQQSPAGFGQSVEGTRTVRRNQPYLSPEALHPHGGLPAPGHVRNHADAQSNSSDDLLPPAHPEDVVVPLAADHSTAPHGEASKPCRAPAPRSACDGQQQLKSSTETAVKERLPVSAHQLEALLHDGSDATTPIYCPSGYAMTVYNGDLSQHYAIPSENVQITRGAIKYVDHHARYGSQTRFRFQLCHNYLQSKCPKLSECSYIHATQLPAPTQVHLNPFAPRRLAADRHGHPEEVPSSFQDDPAIVETYATLPAGFRIRVYAPNAMHATDGGKRRPPPPQIIASEQILNTIGGHNALHHVHFAAAGPASHCRPRHCAHYQYKRVCNLGDQCHFVHSKVPFADAVADVNTASATAPASRPRHADANCRGRRATSGAAQAPTTYPPPPVATYPVSDPSFVAGMQYALQLLLQQQQHHHAAAIAALEHVHPAALSLNSGAAASQPGAAQFGHSARPVSIPIPSPPSVSVTPFAAGLTGRPIPFPPTLAGHVFPAASSGPLASIAPA